MPVPITDPIPRAVRLSGPRARRSDGRSASACSSAILRTGESDMVHMYGPGGSGTTGPGQSCVRRTGGREDGRTEGREDGKTGRWEDGKMGRWKHGKTGGLKDGSTSRPAVLAYRGW